MGLNPFCYRRLGHLVLFVTIYCLTIANAVSALIEEYEEPPPIGNFALSKSQRPGAFYSGGSKILDPGQLQYTAKPAFTQLTRVSETTAPSTLQFGTSKHTAVFIALPLSLDRKARLPNGETSHLRGIGNITIQGEYEFLRRTRHTEIEEAGLLFSVAAPTSSGGIEQHWSAYSLGVTYTHTWFNWLFFSEGVAELFEGPTIIRPGDLGYLNTGIGRNLIPEATNYNFLAFLEFSGAIAQATPIHQIFAYSPHPLGAAFSDGYAVFISPSLWYSDKNWIVQLIYTSPLNQHWDYTSEKYNYGLSLAISYTII